MPYNKWVPLQTELESSGLTLVPVTNNLIDIIWENKPNPPCSLLEPLPLKYSGICHMFGISCNSVVLMMNKSLILR